MVDGLLTNFHLPRTTLLMLVAALAGRERVLAAYAEAVKKEVSLLQLRRCHADFVAMARLGFSILAQSEAEPGRVK